MQIQALLPLLLCIVGVCIAQGPGDVNLGPSDHNCTGLTFAEPNPDRCDQYFICFTVTVDLWQCSPSGNFLFDERYMGCNYPEYTSCGNRPRPTSSVKPTVSTTPLPPFHCPSSTGNFPVDPSQKCSQTYYMCVNGEPFQQTCPGPLVFNVNTCMSAEAAGCSVPTTTPSQGFTCPTQDGFFPSSDTCTQYYQCVGGYPYLKNCPPGLYYNPANIQCDWPYNVPSCTKLNSLKNLISGMISKESEIVKGQKFACPEPNGHYVDPTNCNHYFVCIDGMAVANICPQGLYYDEVHNLCNYSSLVDCQSN